MAAGVRSTTHVDDLVHGWQEIAYRVGRSVRWCKYAGRAGLPDEVRLPTWRLHPGKRAGVVSSVTELDAWVERLRKASASGWSGSVG